MADNTPRGVRFLDQLRAHLLPARGHPRMSSEDERREFIRMARDRMRGGITVPARGLGQIRSADIDVTDTGAFVKPNTETHLIMAYNEFLDALDNPNTKRMIFDAMQAEQFADIIEAGAKPEDGLRSAVHPPFDQMYTEFTEPIFMSEGEPGHNDYLRAFLWLGDASDVLVPSMDPDEEPVTVSVAQVAVFLTERRADGTIEYVDRTFKMHLETGMAFLPAIALLESVDRDEGLVDPSELPKFRDPKTGEVRDALPYEYVIVGMQSTPDGEPARHMGWFERTIQRYADLITYTFAYTSAKSVRVVEAPLTRHERRWHHRNHTPPRPWHVIEVDPKFQRAHDSEEKSGRTVSYRFDVIGHFVVGKWKTKEGYVHHIVWRKPHQRGLAHTLYIPATHKVSGGKRISPVMAEVYGDKGTSGLVGSVPEEE